MSKVMTKKQFKMLKDFVYWATRYYHYKGGKYYILPSLCFKMQTSMGITSVIACQDIPFGAEVVLVNDTLKKTRADLWSEIREVNSKIKKAIVISVEDCKKLMDDYCEKNVITA